MKKVNGIPGLLIQLMLARGSKERESIYKKIVEYHGGWSSEDISELQKLAKKYMDELDNI
jgi:hypothetical protein